MAKPDHHLGFNLVFRRAGDLGLLVDGQNPALVGMDELLGNLVGNFTQLGSALPSQPPAGSRETTPGFGALKPKRATPFVPENNNYMAVGHQWYHFGSTLVGIGMFTGRYDLAFHPWPYDFDQVQTHDPRVSRKSQRQALRCRACATRW